MFLSAKTYAMCFSIIYNSKLLTACQQLFKTNQELVDQTTIYRFLDELLNLVLLRGIEPRFPP
jgi:uncharacterized protein YerC